MSKQLIFGENLGLYHVDSNEKVRRGDVIKYGNHNFMIMGKRRGTNITRADLLGLKIERGNPVWEWWGYPDPSKFMLTPLPLYLGVRKALHPYGIPYTTIIHCKNRKMSWLKYTGWIIKQWKKNGIWLD